MKLGDRVQRPTTVTLRVIDGYYEVLERGYSRPMPVLHFHGRTLDDEYRHFSVDGFRPYLLIPSSIDADTLEEIEVDRRVLDIQVADRDGLGDEDRGAVDLLRVVVTKPWQVREIRQALHDQGVQTYEADVLFPQRFLIDVAAWSGESATDYVEIPRDANEPLDPTDVESASPEHGVAPRVGTIDLEVYNEGEMPLPKNARREIIAATAYDSTVGDYRVWALRNDTAAWTDIGGGDLEASTADVLDVDVETIHVDVYDDERSLVADLISYLLERRFDVLGAWNVGFDAPYLVNRCFELDLYAIENLSPTGTVDRHEDGGRFINSDITGVHVFDFLKAWEKSLFHTPESKTLEHATTVETDMEKLDVDEQAAWESDPEALVAYNARDVQAVLEINDAKDLL
jgi:DNA polymerase elongation subunit (family B)